MTGFVIVCYFSCAIFLSSIIILFCSNKKYPEDRLLLLLFSIITGCIVVVSIWAYTKFDIDTKIRHELQSRLIDNNPDIMISKTCEFKHAWVEFSYRAKSQLGNEEYGSGIAEVDNYNIKQVWLSVDNKDNNFMRIFGMLAPSGTYRDCINIGDKTLDLMSQHATDDQIQTVANNIQQQSKTFVK